MGLDMYLYTNSKKVCQEVNDQTDEWERDFQTPRGIAIYWRKANAIHKWFVDNIQGGKDDCGYYPVDMNDLARLHDACRKVLDSTKLVESEGGDILEDASVAMEELPTVGGFFFGSTNYDGWYWWDLLHTVEKIEAIMENLMPAPKDSWRVIHKDEPDWYVEFYYHSSW